MWGSVGQFDANDFRFALTGEVQLGGPERGRPGMGNQQAAFGPDDFRGISWFGFHAAHKVGGDAFRELQAAAHGQVYAEFLVKMRVSLGVFRFGVGEEAGEVHAVAANVHQRAATGIGPVARIIGRATLGGPVGADVQQAANFTGGDATPGFGHLRMKPVHETFHQPTPICVRGGEHLFDLGAGGGQRFFAEDMFARSKSANAPLAVQSIVQGINDEIHLGIINEGIVGWVRARDIAFYRGVAGPFCVTAGDGHNYRIVDQREGVGVLAEHPARAQNAAAEFLSLAHRWKRSGGSAVVKEIVLTSTVGRGYAATAMTQGVKWLYLLTLAVWIGSIVFFSFAVAPTVFKTLKPEDAAALIRRIFSKYYLIGIICAALSIVCLGLLLFDRAFSKWPAILSLLLVAGMGATDFWLRQAVMPHMNELRDRRAMFESSGKAPDEMLDREWKGLHRLSVQLNVVVLLCGMVLIFLVVYARVV